MGNRKVSNIPVIMLTAKGETFDSVDLSLADDYIVKPLSQKSLWPGEGGPQEV